MDFYPTSLYLARNGPGWVGILPPVSRCCDSKELEINLSYNHFFCGPRPTTNINQISSFRALSLRAFTRSLGPFPPLSVAVCRLFLFLPLGPPAHCTCIYIQEHPYRLSTLLSDLRRTFARGNRLSIFLFGAPRPEPTLIDKRGARATG